MKTLLIDIETKPTLAYVWGLFNQNIGINQIVEPGRMLCFASEWLEKPYGPEFHAEWQDQGRLGMILEAWRLLDEADAVIHYNGARFDVPHLNAEFFEYGLTPPSPFQQIDLLTAVRKQFRIPSKKLAYVTEWAGLPSKVQTGGFNLWIEAMAGDHKAQRKMERYNRTDTKIMRELYYKLLPWIPNHPNRVLYDGEGCPKCGVRGRLIKRGMRRTSVGAYQRYRCEECGSWSSSGKREYGTDIREMK